MNYSDDQVEASIITHAMTQRDSLIRSRIMAEIDKEYLEKNPDEQGSAYFWHPIAISCSAGTITYKEAEPRTINVRGLTLPAFGDLPAVLWDKWLGELLETNQHLFNPEPIDSKKN